MKTDLNLARLLAVKKKLHQIILKELNVSARERLKTNVDNLLGSDQSFADKKHNLPLLYARALPAFAPRLEQFLYQHFSNFYTTAEIDTIIKSVF